MVSADPSHHSRSACRITITRLAGALLLMLVTSTAAVAQSTTPGVLQSYSTIYSIGVEWNISGDSNHNAGVAVEYRVQGSGTWKQALPLVRVDYNGRNMLAGSVLFLSPGTSYEVKLDLADPDGGAETRTITVGTRPLPSLPTGGRTFHVVPGGGGGSGTSGDPFRGIGAAQAVAQSGDIFLVHAGNYGGNTFNRGGTTNNHIVWKGAGDGEATFGQIVISASNVWLEGLTMRGQAYALLAEGYPSNLVISRCSFLGNNNAITMNGAANGVARDWYVADNVITGNNPLGSESFSGEGIDLRDTGGHTVAYNSISYIADPISSPGTNSDIFGNDIFNTSDDGIEGDTSSVNPNVRMWGNRIHNVGHNGISFQPQNGAPWYIIRNQIVGFRESLFKYRDDFGHILDRHVLLHNTFVSWGGMLWYDDALLKAIVKNNLWIAAAGGELWGFGGSTRDWRTDIDYNAFDWGGATPFSYGGGSYSSVSSLAAASGLETHGRQVNKSTCFETFNVPGPPPTSIPPQFMSLALGCSAIDAGVVLPNINDGFVGAAPDMGAYEVGRALPVYGPRPVGPPDTTPPSVPTGLVATAVSSSQINLSWTASTDNVGVTGYKLYRGGTYIGTSGSTSYSDIALSPATLYSFTVAAFDAAGNTSAQSTSASATTLPPPPPDLIAYRTPGTITIDGNLIDWSGASSANFSGLSNAATAYVSWNDTNLYVAFNVTDTQLNAIRTTRDAGDLYLDDAIELYIDTLNDRAIAMQPDDYQFLVNLNNVQVDLRGTGSGKDITWNATWSSALTKTGTLNNNTDSDTSYVVEMAIPWAQIGVAPVVGNHFSIDLAVDDSDPAYTTFDWAGIAPAPYAQPFLWKRIQLGGLLDTIPPVISAVAVPVKTTSGATITWTTNEASNSQVEYGLTTAYGSSTALDVTLMTTHSVTLTGLIDGRLYHFRVRSRDAAGNLAVSSDFTFTTVEGTLPSVSMTAPAAGTIVSGSVTVTASATDNVGVAQVQFLIGGTPLATDTVAPYEAAWDTSTGLNGPYTLTAVARDLAGNATTSAAVGVTVANEDELAIGLGSFPGQGGWLALGGNQANAFATQLWTRLGSDAYHASNGELHAATGDVDGDGLDEVIVGLGTGGDGWIAVLDDPAHGYQWLRWLQVAWPSYNTANGSVFPAVGDLDGDGRAEIIAGLGAGGGGWIEIFDDAVAGYSHLGWQQVPWSEYNAAVGETHPAVADLDGDGRAEIVLGLSSGGQGFLEVRNGAPGYDHRRWLQVSSAQYNQLNGATFPAAGDVDGDARAEIVVGLGQGGEGWLEVFDDATQNHVHLRWLLVAWTEYNTAVGETHPAVGDLDADSPAEIVIGLGRFSAGLGGWFEILDDANAGYPWLSWQRVGRDAFEQDGGGTFPSVAEQRR